MLYMQSVNEEDRVHLKGESIIYGVCSYVCAHYTSYSSWLS